jgi:hypothetical protein|tara:strand:+ start:625 stop:762 length:138 start_codon:yes stop_codon:yes gene_type:complete
MKLLLGGVIGVVVTVFYPDIIPWATSLFLESGARDVIVDSLKEIK